MHLRNGALALYQLPPQRNTLRRDKKEKEEKKQESNILIVLYEECYLQQRRGFVRLT